MLNHNFNLLPLFSLIHSVCVYTDTHVYTYTHMDMNEYNYLIKCTNMGHLGHFSCPQYMHITH